MSTSPLTSLFRSLTRQPQPQRSPTSNFNPAHTFPYPLDRNPYTCRQPWPPDFSQLSQKHQFRLERRYRRRAKLKYARPTWNKVLKLTQWGAIGFVVVYGVFFLDMEEVVGSRRGEGSGESVEGVERERRRTVFDGLREWWDGKIGGELRDARGGGVGNQGKG